MDFRKITTALAMAACTATNAALAAGTPDLPKPPPSAATLPYANNVHLAYVRGPHEAENQLVATGLSSLAAQLQRRTSIAPSEQIVGLDLERDEILFFRVLYWRLGRDTPALSESAQKKLQSYIDSGGVIIVQASEVRPDGRCYDLERVFGAVGLKGFVQAGPDHLLRRSHFTKSALPAAGSLRPLWVSVPSAANDNTSSIILTDGNWPAAWAGRTTGEGTEMQELTLRAGINMYVYALTGSYKNDQNQKPEAPKPEAPKP